MKESFRGVGKIVVFVLFVLALSAGAIWILNEFEVGASERDQQHAEIVALQAGLDEANERLADQGEPTVDVPPVETSADPPVVPIPPTQEQVAAAVSAYCSGGACRGRDGDDGDDPTVAQVAAAIRDYCADGRCQGEGGTNGEDSTVPGPQGRPPTAGEIATAVVGYCANGACRGATGDTGPPPSAEQVRTQVAAYCAANNGCRGPKGDHGPQGTAKPGTYTCPDGEYIGGFTVADGGGVTLACRSLTPAPVIDPPDPETPTPGD